ncbi:MAG: pyridoxal-phosphate dependent enzyme [Flavobacteriales bacterium]
MNFNTRIDSIHLPELESTGVSLFIKRDDLIDGQVSGNKLYKLRLNIEQAKREGKDTILTFGGAYSNHIAATAKYCKEQGLNSIGIIRGERAEKLNPTLRLAEQNGMQLEFINRSNYRLKSDPEHLRQVSSRFNEPYVIPEGGANLLGIEGSKDILNDNCAQYDFIVSAMGTGTTFAGLVRGAKPNQKVIGIPIHKHEELIRDIINVDPTFEEISNERFKVLGGYHFGGYAKWTNELLAFIRAFHRNTSIKLDPIYTGKAMFACIDLIKTGHFSKGSKMLFIHTGGLQAIPGFEERFELRLF